jgi:hypothetical protein
MEGLCGLIAIDTKVAGVTVRLAVPLIASEVARMVTVPVANVLARPAVPEASLTVATVPSEELQCTVVVTSWLLPSANVPVAENCSVVPSATLADDGDTVIETSADAVTASEVEPLTLPDVALMLVVPTATVVARPEVFTVATAEESDDQVAVLVKSCVLPSLNVPVAVNCCVPPSASEGLGGFTAIDTNMAGVTVNEVEPTIVPEVALMVAIPLPTLLARP